MGQVFCGHCGERKLDAKSRSMRHIISDYIENVTSFENKIWRTLGLLLIRPGSLDRKYHVGERVRYLKPISLFLIINFLFVIFSPITDFNVNLYDQLNLQPYSAWIQPIHQQHFLPTSGLDPATYAAQYNQSVVILARSTIIIQALLFFLCAWLINWQRGYFAGDHLVFALNFHSWYMAWIVLLMLCLHAVDWLVNLLGLDLIYGYWYFLLLPVGTAIYLLLAVHTLYQRTWWQTLLQAALLFAAMRLVHTVYRLIQYFLVTAVIE